MKIRFFFEKVASYTGFLIQTNNMADTKNKKHVVFAPEKSKKRVEKVEIILPRSRPSEIFYIDDNEAEEIILRRPPSQHTRDAEDGHQHYFKDQIHHDRPMWPKDRWWFAAAAMIAYMVDMSNVGTFPILVSEHGGFAFIFAYLVIIVCLVYPILYLEVLLGQYFQTGMIGVWGICPLSWGLGPGLLFLNTLIYANLARSIWSNLMMLEALNSVQTGVLRWLSCDNDWNTCRCIYNKDRECQLLKKNSTEPDTDIYSSGLEYFIGYVLRMWKTHYADPLTVKDITENGDWSTAYGFTNNLEGLGPMITQSAISVIVIFIVILSFAISPIRYQGYLYTFTGVYTVFVLLGLLFRAMILDGAFDGVSKYFNTDFGKLDDFSVWASAFTAAFHSVAPGFGCHGVISSFSPLRHDFRRNIIIALTVDTTTHLLSTFIAFMFIGFLYKTADIPLPTQYPGENFIFITFAESFGTISGSSFFAAIYYFMLLAFSIDTQVVAFHSTSFSLYEEYKRKYPSQDVSQTLFLFTIWGFALALNLVFTTRGGYWVFAFMQEYFYGFTISVLVLVEIFVFSWLWGIEEICKAAEATLGSRPSVILRLFWKFVLPVVYVVFIIQERVFHDLQPVQVFGQVAPPETTKWGLAFVLIQWAPPVILVIYMFYSFFHIGRKGKSCKQGAMLVLSPEYDHELILEDVKNAKRLSCSHYWYIMREGELKAEFEWMIELVTRSKWREERKVKAAIEKAKLDKQQELKRQEEEEERQREQELIRKKEKKKKRKGRRSNDEEVTAWELWEKMQKEHYDDDEVGSVGSDDENDELRRNSSDLSIGSSNSGSNGGGNVKVSNKKKKPAVKRNQVKPVNTIPEEME